MGVMRLFASDAETYSALELKKHGAYLYARHPSTNVRCVSYCLIVDGQRGPVKVWYPAIRRRPSFSTSSMIPTPSRWRITTPSTGRFIW
jgi:hypothetical protein